jgi:hypothetical protein
VERRGAALTPGRGNPRGCSSRSAGPMRTPSRNASFDQSKKNASIG